MARTKDETLAWLRQIAGELATATLKRLDGTLPWYREMPPGRRSAVGLVAQAGIRSFISWYEDPTSTPWIAADVFGGAPRELLRSVSLQQTLQLIRVTVEVVEERVNAGTDESLREGILLYSREIAFAAADVYARAAEARGLWDARLEALVVDSILSGEPNDELPSRIAALGWHGHGEVAVVVGTTPRMLDVDQLRRTARHLGADVLIGVQGTRLVLVLGRAEDENGHRLGRAEDENGRRLGRTEDENGRRLGRTDDENGRRLGPTEDENGRTPGRTEDERGPRFGRAADGPDRSVGHDEGGPGRADDRQGRAEDADRAGAARSDEEPRLTFLQMATTLEEYFGPGSIVLGNTVPDLVEASRSARGALAGFAVVRAWRRAPRTVPADDLLPERALAGDALARQTLVARVYVPLRDHSGELLGTLWAYLDNGRSLEATARELFVHPNTVRYRLKRISELIGWDATGAREALILHDALILGAISEPSLPRRRPVPR